MTVNVRRVWDMYAAGKKPRQIAKALGLSVGCVTNRLSRAKGELGMYRVDVEAGEAAELPRCRCGLLLPCESCVPRAEAYVFSGHGRTYPAGMGYGR